MDGWEKVGRAEGTKQVVDIVSINETLLNSELAAEYNGKFLSIFLSSLSRLFLNLPVFRNHNWISLASLATEWTKVIHSLLQVVLHIWLLVSYFGLPDFIQTFCFKLSLYCLCGSQLSGWHTKAEMFICHLHQWPNQAPNWQVAVEMQWEVRKVGFVLTSSMHGASRLLRK